ncbi:MAG: IS21 family transposase, partial [Methylobacter sp.]|nr:IS21 family transposase [Methylobacter sp.]
LEKGQVIKNTHHYRDQSLRIETLERDLEQLVGQETLAMALCTLLKASSPKIYKDQLAGAKQVLTEHRQRHGEIPETLLSRLVELPRLTASGLKQRLEAWRLHPERLTPPTPSPADRPSSAALARYGTLNGRSTGQGESHAIY